MNLYFLNPNFTSNHGNPLIFERPYKIFQDLLIRKRGLKISKNDLIFLRKVFIIFLEEWITLLKRIKRRR
jgi:hypothetical protein